MARSSKWDARYPRLITKEYLRTHAASNGLPTFRLRVIGDISCDIEGAIESTLHTTNPGNPVYVYDPLTGETSDGVEGRGVVILAVDNLPCEIPLKASTDFSHVLKDLVPSIVTADYSEAISFEALELPPEVKNAVILYHGELTPKYKYLEEYLTSI